MTKFSIVTLYFLRLTGCLLILAVVIAVSSSAQAQPVLGAQNTAMGSGGTTYLTGFETTFWNPANLAINNRQGQTHLGVGQIGILYQPVLSTDAAEDQFLNFTDSFFPYKPGTADITLEQREDILDKKYPQSNLLSQHQTRADVILGGVSWQRGDAAFSVAARSRFASRIEVGRGWYSNEFIPSGDQQIRDFTLNQQINQLFELSVGYGRQFTFIDGLLPRLSELYVGIAPKIVLAGPSFNATYNARYIRPDEGSTDIYTTDFSYHSTGKYSRMTSHYLASANPQPAIERNLNRTLNLLDNTGYGMGFDFGLTYLIPLDLSIIEDDPDKSVVSQSIRFSFSVNDLGMIHHTKNPLELTSSRDTVQIVHEPAKESMFIGSGGQYLNYFDDANILSNPILEAENNNSNKYSTLLPTSLNAGMLVDLSRIKVSGDLTLGLNNTAFTNTKLAIHLGLEARPIKAVPIRFGTRVASDIPTYLGVGTGIETRYWDLNIGTQIILRSRTFTSEFAGGAFAGIQFHL
jgi:hypothetical protein